jgi:hypothetical protein
VVCLHVPRAQVFFLFFSFCLVASTDFFLVRKYCLTKLCCRENRYLMTLLRLYL